MPKNDLRAVLLRQRRNLDASNVKLRSAAVVRRLIQLPELKAASCVGVYLAVRNEVDLSELIHSLCNAGRTVCIPRALQNGALEFAAFDEACIAPGPLGVHEPDETALHVPIETIDLLLVPGVAFDKRGHRIGMGAGYYDRTLGAAPRRPLTVGVGYDFQLQDELPYDPWDIPLDMVVTESTTLRPSQR